MRVKPYLTGWMKYAASIKKFYFLLPFLGFFSVVNFGFAADYYFSSSTGNDSRSSWEAQNSATPWNSIDKLNSMANSLQAGDRVLFKSGDVFYGTIRIPKSGASGASIQYTSYGSGAKPIITSMARVTNWVAIGNGLYQADLSGYYIEKLQILLLNDQIKEIGRTPNSGDSNGGYLTITNANSFSSINMQNGAPYSGSGGEVVIRKNNWIIDRHTIDYIGGTTVNYRTNESPYGPQKNFGYFLQNHPSLLDKTGEWSYDPNSKKLTINLSGLNISSTNVSVATLDNLLINNSYINNFSISNLNFRGSNSHLLNISRSNNVNITNCDLIYAGENAISASSVQGLVAENNQINHSLNSGIFMAFGTPAAVIRNNSISNTMPFQGMAKSSDIAGVGIYVASDGERSIIEKNNVINTGFNAIHFGGSYTKVINNFIDNFCILKQDGGGIYTNSNGLSNSNNIGREITGNIVLNGKGTKFGTLEEVDMAEGIYIDDNSAGVKVNKNTVAYMSGKSIYLHNANNITITENLFYKSRSQVQLTHSNIGGPIRNISVSQNQFSSIDKIDQVYSIYSIENDIGSVGSFFSNYFLDPFGHDIFIKTKGSNDGPTGVDRNLNSWSNSFGYDGNAIKPELNLSTYNITSSSLIKESDFSSNSSIISGVYGASSGLQSTGISGGTFKISPNSSNNATAYIQVGAVQPGEKILVEFDMRGTPADKAIELFLEETYNADKGVGNARVSTTSSTKSHKVLLTSVVSKGNESIVIRIPASASEVWMDNIKINKVTTQNIEKDSYIVFAYNATSSPVQKSLNGTYKNGKNETFSGSITLPAYGSAILARISGVVAPPTNGAPTVALTNPNNNQVFVKGVNPVELVANAQDPEGKIKQVEFYNWGNLVTTVTSPPYTLNWSAIELGNYQVYAKVIDEQNLTAISTTVQFSVTNDAPAPPIAPNYSAQMISPFNNSTFALGSQEVILQTNAASSGLKIQKVEFFNWGFPLITVSSGKFDYTWSKIEADTYNVYAKVTDERGVVFTTEPIRFRITAPVAPAPQLSINVTQPYSNQNFTLGQQPVKVKADVSSTESIRSIQIFNWGYPLATVSNAPYEFDWTKIEVGEYQITAIVTDVNGKTSTSNTVKFRVNSPWARTADSVSTTNNRSLAKVEMIHPADNDVFELGSDPILLQAKASEKVSKVEFFNWYLPLATPTNGQSELNLSDMEVGDYLVYAQITDLEGNTADSDPIRFKVIDPSNAISKGANELEPKDGKGVGSYGITMGPNPASTHVNIFFDDYPKDYKGVISVLDVQGNEKINTDFNTSDGTVTLDLAFLKSGLYVVRLNFGNGLYQSQKLVKL